MASFIFLLLCAFIIQQIQAQTFRQDIAHRYWYNKTENINQTITWSFLPMQSITQILSLNSDNINPPLWFIDGYDHQIYATDSTSHWHNTLKPVIINTDGAQNIINPDTYILLYPLQDTTTTTFYAIVTNSKFMQFWYCSNAWQCNILSEDIFVKTNCGITISKFDGYLGTTQGLIKATIKDYNANTPNNAIISLNSDFIISDKNVTAITYLKSHNILAISTSFNETGRIWRYNLSAIKDNNYNNTNEYQYNYINFQTDNYTTSMQYIESNGNIDLYVTNLNAINVYRMITHINSGIWIRIGRHQGLPYNNITQMVLGWDNTIWFGHYNGAVSRFISSNNNNLFSITGKWRYYQGHRYLPDGDIITMYSAMDMIFISTQFGLSVIIGNKTDLITKANMIESINYPRHDRYGLVADCGLHSVGNLSSWFYSPSDNDGLWTSMYVSGLIFKYNQFKDNNTLNLIWHHTNALTKMHEITGVNYGFVPRSFCKVGDYCCNDNCGGEWHNSTTINGWVYKGDTSSDEICGHMAVYSLLYDIIAINEQQSHLFLKMMTSIVDWIIDNKYKYIGPNGPTLWGYWDPSSLNFNCANYCHDGKCDNNCDDRGLNSLQILSWILECYHYTTLHVSLYPNSTTKYNPQKYLNAWNELGITNGYFINIINTRINIPDDINWSDDELHTLAYFSYFWTRNEHNKWMNKSSVYANNIRKDWNKYVEPYYINFELSWNRTYNSLKSPYQSWFTIMDVFFNNKFNDNVLINQIKQDLETWPMEWIPWIVDNSNRIDIVKDSTMGRSCDGNPPKCATIAFPHSESNGDRERWNSNPYKLMSGGESSEVDTGAFTLSFWMAKYFDLV
eukprot:498406_1